MAPFAPEVGALVDRLIPLVSAVAVSMGRPAGSALVLPVFTRAQLGGPVRGAVAFALGLAAVPGIDAELAAHPVSLPLLALLGVKEAFVGLLIGVLLGVPIWAVQCAGEFIDTQRSATQDRQPEPGSGNQNSTTGNFLGMTVVALFVISGGLNALASTIGASYGVWPALQFLPLPTTGWAGFLFGLLDHVARVSLSLAAPVVIGMVMCEACVILLMRAVPKLHVYDLAPTLRNLMFVVLMLAYAQFLVAYMHREIGHLQGAAAQLRELLR